MPSFCRHNRFAHNCPVCSPREATPKPAPKRTSPAAPAGATRKRSTGSSRSSNAVRVRHMARAEEDGYTSRLVSGLRATADAEQLADELGFAAGRLAELGAAPLGLYAEAGSAPDPDEGAWLAAQVVLLGPEEGVDDPFAALREVVVPWAGGAVPDTDLLAERARAAVAAHEAATRSTLPASRPARTTAAAAVNAGRPGLRAASRSGLGPRSPYADAAAARRGLTALRTWAERNGGLAAALAGDASWTPERRFERLYERLGTVSGIGRGRYDLLVVLGQLGIAELRATTLAPGDSDDATLAAKRVFGIGDRLLLDRRAIDLAQEAQLPVATLDLALANLGRPAGTPRMTIGASAGAADPGARDGAAAALGV